MNLLRPATCFALGAGLGFLSWSFIASPSPASGETTTPAPADTNLATTSAPTGSIPSASSDTDLANGTSARPASAADPRLHLWEALALRGAADEQLGKWVRPPGLTQSYGFRAADPDAPLNPDFVAFFDLTAGEQARIQTFLRETLLQQREMDRAHIRPIESKFRIKQAIEIPAYADEAATLRQTYENNLRATLGEARYAVYRDWAGESFKTEFPGLAGMIRQYHFIPEETDPTTQSHSPTQIVFQSRPAGTDWTSYHSTYVVENVSDSERTTGLPLARYFGPDAPPSTATADGKASK